ncbi:MAG: DUF6291 domain-containing protein, partial [Prevotellaceae bacterium]|nr:DUF6291 domain-containing protein [Prevotellaceae bacterium]
MARERQGFIFGFKWGKALRNLPAELRHEVQDAIIDYGTDGTVIPMSDAARGIFEFIRIQIDDNNSKYENTVEKRREAGRQGGAPAGNHNASQKQAKQANGCFNKQNNQKQAKQADYDYDCDCDCDCDKKKKISASP